MEGQRWQAPADYLERKQFKFVPGKKSGQSLGLGDVHVRVHPR